MPRPHAARGGVVTPEFAIVRASPTIHWSPDVFPEYRDLITQLKSSDRHFLHLFDQHNALDQKIKNMESHVEPGSPTEIEILKKEKLALKDHLYAILRKAAAAG